MASCLNRSRSINGFTLLELIGILAAMAILAAVLIPNAISRLYQQSLDTEQKHLEHIAKGVEVYFYKNLAFPSTLASLTPDYVPYPTAQLTDNERGYERYYYVHPTMDSFSNPSGLASSDVDDARFLLISNLTQDEAPTITNATQFETWWTTDESATPGLHIYRGNLGDGFYQLTITGEGAGASYQLNGTATNSGGTTLTTHTKHHLIGTPIKFDEADTYATPEVQFALTTNTAYWFDPNCTVGKQWNPLDPDCDSGGILWLSTTGTSDGTPGITWNDSAVVAFDDPNLTYQNGPANDTDGTFAAVFDMEDFTSSTDVDGIHYVTTNITVGNSSTIDLFVGDVVLSLHHDDTLTSTNSLTVKDGDVFVFRPDTAGDYSAGTFIMLIDESDIGYGDLNALSLVETTISVGGVTLNAGDFLLAEDGEEKGADIDRFVPDNVGTTSSGTKTIFVDGSDINMSGENKNINGIHLVTSNITVGDVNLTAGQILTSLDSNDSSTGDNSISTDDSDIFILDITTAGSSTAATATLFFDGSDVNMSDGSEDVNSITLIGSGSSSPPSSGVTILDAWVVDGTYNTQDANFAVSAGSNRLVLVGLSAEKNGSGPIAVTNVTLGDKNLVELYDITEGSTFAYHNLLWFGYLKEADIAARSGDGLTITYSNAPSNPFDEPKIHYASYQNVNQTTPISDSQTNQGSGTSITLTGTVSSVDEKVIAFNISGQHSALAVTTGGFTELTVSIGATNGHASAMYHRTATTAFSGSIAFTQSVSSRILVMSVVLGVAPP